MSMETVVVEPPQQPGLAAPDRDQDRDLPGESRARLLAGRLAVPVVLVALQAVLSRHWLLQVRAGVGRRNLEASYHALLTVRALLSTPFDQHLGLPVVTLGQANDKWISWGATVRTGAGDYIYTSFPPAGFWLPAVVAFFRGGDLGLGGLVVINGVLAALSVVLLHVLVVRAVRRMGRTVWVARGAGLASAVMYLFSTETLQSTGAVYWAQCLMQPLLLGMLVVLDRLLVGDVRRRRGLLVLLGVLTAVGGYTEWTAYVFALLTGGAILLTPALRRRMAAAGVVLVSVAVVTAAVLAAHFILVLGVDGAVAGWTTRFAARSGSTTTLLDLQYGYALSFGGALFTALVLAGLAALRPAVRGRVEAVGGVIVAFSSTAVVENLILRQHATEFTFDRLKLGIPLALITGLAIGRLSRRLFVLAGAVVLLGAVAGVAGHRTDSATYADWPAVDRGNRALVAAAQSKIDFRCATLGTDMSVRGYTDLLVDRGVHEVVAQRDMPTFEAEDKGSCGTVYITARMVHTDLPQFLSITVVTRGRAPQVVTP